MTFVWQWFYPISLSLLCVNTSLWLTNWTLKGVISRLPFVQPCYFIYYISLLHISTNILVGQRGSILFVQFSYKTWTRALYCSEASKSPEKRPEIVGHLRKIPWSVFQGSRACVLIRALHPTRVCWGSAGTGLLGGTACSVTGVRGETTRH